MRESRFYRLSTLICKSSANNSFEVHKYTKKWADGSLLWAHQIHQSGGGGGGWMCFCARTPVTVVPSIAL